MIQGIGVEFATDEDNVVESETLHNRLLKHLPCKKRLLLVVLVMSSHTRGEPKFSLATLSTRGLAESKLFDPSQLPKTSGSSINTTTSLPFHPLKICSPPLYPPSQP